MSLKRPLGFVKYEGRTSVIKYSAPILAQSKIFPGFMMPSGSKTLLIPFIN